MTNNLFVESATDHLKAVAETRAHLSDLYEKSRRGMRPDERNALGAHIAEAHQSIGYGLKVAGVHAALAQAVATEALIEKLEGKA